MTGLAGKKSIIKNEFTVPDRYSHYTKEIQDKLKDKIVSEISETPLKWIIGDPELKIVRRASKGKKTIIVGTNEMTKYYVSYGNIILNAVPTHITRFENPLSSFLGQIEKYKITFDSQQRRIFTLEGTIDKILSQLDAKGCVMSQYSSKEALTWMINAYEDNKQVKIDKSVDFEGYLYYDGDLRISRIDFKRKHPRRTKKECIKYIDYLEKRSEFYQWEYEGREIDRRDWLASAIKWIIAAPFNFAIKQLTGKYQQGFSFSGERDGGKTEMSNMMLETHGNFTDRDSECGSNSIYSLTAGQMDTSAKFGKGVSKTTYPIAISEFGKVENYGRNESLAEDMKNAIEKLVCRSGRDGSQYDIPFPSCSSIIINGNPYLSRKDTIIKRFNNIRFSQEDRHEPDSARTKEFNEFKKLHAGLDKILGDWTMNYIWNNRRELILSKKYDSRQLGEIVIKKFFEFAGRPIPEWLTLWITDTALEELDVDESDIIRAVLYDYVHKSMQQGRSAHIIKVDPEDEELYVNMEMRVNQCLDNTLWSFIRKGNYGSYWIDSSILGLFKERLPDLTLKKLGEKIPGATYKHTMKGWRLQCSRGDIVDFIVGIGIDDQKT